jgi:ABC-type dipeptide/oligopeptide/nickel transport system permease subunit
MIATIIRQLLRRRRARVGLALLGLFALLAALGPLLVGDPGELVGRPLSPPSAAHWLGTTGQGQDVLTQLVAGARPTLLASFAVGMAVVLLGAVVGIGAGAIGGRVDDLLSLVINVFLVIPGLPLLVVVAAYLTPGPGTLVLVLSLIGWAWTARILRAEALALGKRDHVEAARVLGEGHLRVIFGELLPSMVPLVSSCFVGAVLHALAALVGLEFLGLGQIERVSWGTMLYWASNQAALITGSWWTFVPIGLLIGLVGLALGLVGSALDELAHPRLRVDRAFVRAVGHLVRPDAATPVLTREPPR